MNDYANALPVGFRLHEYEVVRVLGYGGFGITYLGYDHHLDKAVAIKEFLPRELATRSSEWSVVAHSATDREDFRWGLERFLEEARTLARFDDRHIVKVYRFFEAHGTGYIVMEYAEGEPLSERLRRCGRLSEDEFKGLLLPILSGLERVHDASFLHRDIKPGNIMVRADGSPVLIDFGAARQAVGAKSRSVTSIVTPGYAPIEQYSTKGHQGPWTDIYALGAVGYRALTGRDPEDATERVRNDPLESLTSMCRGEASEEFLAALDWALRVDERDRPQDVAAFRAALLGDAVPAGAETVQAGRKGAEGPTPPAERAVPAGSGAVLPKKAVWTIVGAGVIGLVVLLGWLGRDNEPPSVAQTQELPARSEPVSRPAEVERRELVSPTVQVEPPASHEPVTPRAPVAAPPSTYGLTVVVEPVDARVRILNIIPRYQAGMQLEPGRYHIEVSKAGYQTYREWLEVVDRDMVQRVALRAEAPARWNQFERVSNGVLDRQQGVIWAVADNGRDISWRDARSYCSSLGSGWSLPSIVQLQNVFLESTPHPRRIAGLTIRPATDLIQWTGLWYWSAESKGSSDALFVSLVDGAQRSYLQSGPGYSRALCVRRR